MKKIHLLCFLFFIFFSIDSIGQTEENTNGRINEPTISFTSIYNFGFIYKLEQKNNWYWRFLLLYGKQSAYKDIEDESNFSSAYFSPGIGLGIEKRFPIANKLQFKTGADVIFSYHQEEFSMSDSPEDYQKNKTSNTSYQLKAIIGLNYLINEHFLISVEFTPYVSYYINKWIITANHGEGEISSTRTVERISYSLSNKTVSVALAYRFWKTKNK